MPLALITAAAAGDAKNLMNSFAAAGSFAPVPMPVANTVVSHKLGAFSGVSVYHDRFSAGCVVLGGW